jgi:GH24 family phage-related lysozyme (muramidase)
MKIDRLVKSLKFEEGYRATPYKDTKGIWTIAYGFTSVNGVKVTQYTPMLSDLDIYKNLYNHIFKALNIAMRFVNNFCELSDIRREVLTNMCYQMGTRVLNFTKTKMYIEQRNFKQASIEMLDSNWARIDSPKRAQRMSELFK